MLNLSASTLDEILNTTFEGYIRNKMFAQADQATPALKIMRELKKTFPGGEGLKLTATASFEYTTDWEIYSGEDQLTFNEMNNKKLFTYEGIENHMGLKIPYTALKATGFKITDANTKGSMDFAKASKSDALRITNFLDGKFTEMDFSATQSFSKKRIWSDGANGFIGLVGLISKTPTTGITGALSRDNNPKWRNRALVGANEITPSGANQTLSATVQEEIRLLRVNGGMPDAIFAGNKAIRGFELEVRANGTLTETGFMNGNTDIGIKGINILGLPAIIHEPALDDLSLSDHFYIIDTKSVNLTMLEGDDMQVHLPSRPFDRMAGYKSLTWTGLIAAKQLNGSGVYQVDDTNL